MNRKEYGCGCLSHTACGSQANSTQRSFEEQQRLARERSAVSHKQEEHCAWRMADFKGLAEDVSVCHVNADDDNMGMGE